MVAGLCALNALGQSSVEDLPRLLPGHTKAQNALWIENDLSLQFKSSKSVVVADIKGPAEITMIHFAMPDDMKLNRDLLLRVYWDGETTASVDVPLVDFFCDPNGLRETVNTILVNKRRGFNAYFPMPFRRSAKIELDYDGTLEPGQKLWKAMPCYSYVMYRTGKSMGRDTGYFHASWRQEALLLGERDYLALDAKGRGKFIGWNVTVRSPGRGNYPVDENEKFYIDGEKEASVEFQGLEDSFGFSWGFPHSENDFPMTGYFPYMKGATAYRFFLQDAISFESSLRVTIGFGAHESPFFRKEYSKPGSTLQLSSTVYWYQTEPHAPLPAMPPALERAPAPEQAFWPEKETLPTAADFKRDGVKLALWCGRPGDELIYAENGYGATARQGTAWSGWAPPVYHARADEHEVAIDLRVPQKSAGKVKLFIIDPDEFHGGRREQILVGGDDLGMMDKFVDGRWVEHALTAEQTASGVVPIRALNKRDDANAVISLVEWVEK